MKPLTVTRREFLGTAAAGSFSLGFVIPALASKGLYRPRSTPGSSYNRMTGSSSASRVPKWARAA